MLNKHKGIEKSELSSILPSSLMIERSEGRVISCGNLNSLYLKNVALSYSLASNSLNSSTILAYDA